MKIEYWKGWNHKWTFLDKNTIRFISKYIPFKSKILIPFAGKFRFGNIDGSKFYYNDINPNLNANHHIDAYKLVWLYKQNSFDCIIADPPYSIRKAVEVYKNKKHMKLFRFHESMDWLLRPGGIYIELGYDSSGLNGYENIALGIYNPGIKIHDVLIIIQKKPNQIKF